MSGAAIAAEISAALREAAIESGDGELIATLTKVGTQVNPWDAPATLTTHAVAVVVTEYDLWHVDGVLIQVQDRRVLVEAVGVVPEPADTLTIGGVVYNVVRCMPLAPGGVAVMYEVQCRTQ